MAMINQLDRRLLWSSLCNLAAVPWTEGTSARNLVRFVVFLQGFLTVSCHNTTAVVAPPYDSPVHQEETKDKPFPTWLIGVIILSIMIFFVAAITLVQRILRARARRTDRYGLSS